jgi:hypothetical protein
MSSITELGTLDLAGTKKGKISISNVTEPYGKDTADIVSKVVNFEVAHLRYLG